MSHAVVDAMNPDNNGVENLIATLTDRLKFVATRGSMHRHAAEMTDKQFLKVVEDVIDVMQREEGYKQWFRPLATYADMIPSADGKRLWESIATPLGRPGEMALDAAVPYPIRVGLSGESIPGYTTNNIIGFYHVLYRWLNSPEAGSIEEMSVEEKGKLSNLCELAKSGVTVQVFGHIGPPGPLVLRFLKEKVAQVCTSEVTGEDADITPDKDIIIVYIDMSFTHIDINMKQVPLGFDRVLGVSWTSILHEERASGKYMMRFAIKGQVYEVDLMDRRNGVAVEFPTEWKDFVLPEVGPGEPAPKPPQAWHKDDLWIPVYAKKDTPWGPQGDEIPFWNLSDRLFGVPFTGSMFLVPSGFYEGPLAKPKPVTERAASHSVSQQQPQTAHSRPGTAAAHRRRHKGTVEPPMVYSHPGGRPRESSGTAPIDCAEACSVGKFQSVSLMESCLAGEDESPCKACKDVEDDDCPTHANHDEGAQASCIGRGIPPCF